MALHQPPVSSSILSPRPNGGWGFPAAVALVPGLAWGGAHIAVWAARRLGVGVETRFWIEPVVLCSALIVFVVACVILALRTGWFALPVTALAMGTSITTAEMVRLALGLMVMPGMYQIDYERREFIRDASVFAFELGMWAALVAAVIAMVTLGLRGLSRRLGGRAVNDALV